MPNDVDVNLIIVLRKEMEDARTRIAAAAVRAVEQSIGTSAINLPDTPRHYMLSPTQGLDELMGHVRTYAMLVKKYNEVFSRVYRTP